MERTTILSLSTLPGSPRVKTTLPGPLRVGDKVGLSFTLKRQHQGRTEILEVRGDWRVTASTTTALHFHLEVECASGVEPRWKAVKKDKPFVRRLGPAVFPREAVG